MNRFLGKIRHLLTCRLQQCIHQIHLIGLGFILCLLTMWKILIIPLDCLCPVGMPHTQGIMRQVFFPLYCLPQYSTCLAVSVCFSTFSSKISNVTLCLLFNFSSEFLNVGIIFFHSDLLPPGVGQDSSTFRSRNDGYTYDYSRRVFGATMDSIGRSRSGRY